MDAFQWFTVAQTAVMALVTVVLWTMRARVQVAVDQHDTTRRLAMAEKEIERMREWRHNVIVPWQTTLLLALDERYLLRREQVQNGDSPFPKNRRR